MGPAPRSRSTASTLRRRPPASGKRRAAGWNAIDQIDERRVLRELKAVAKDLDVEDATVHAFRHFFITFAADRGKKPTQVMAWVCRRDLAVILT